jgi:WhiB family transcriptional regulator, redox-sensing transcriptional regulator
VTGRDRSVAAGVMPGWMAELLDRPDWFDRAACRGLSPSLWYPDVYEQPTAREAVAVCRGCPVQVECLDRACGIGGDCQGAERNGVWGGMSVLERRRLLSAIRRNPDRRDVIIRTAVETMPRPRTTRTGTDG